MSFLIFIIIIMIIIIIIIIIIISIIVITCVVVLLPKSPPLDWVVVPPKPVGLKAEEAPNEVLAL